MPSIAEDLSLENKDVGSAFGQLSKEGILKMDAEKNVEIIFSRLCQLFKLSGWKLKFMQRHLDEQGRGILNLKKTFKLAHVNLKNKTISLDIYTPRHRKPKAINSILRILAHEIAHSQKPPFRQHFHGRTIIRQHYPEFYQQVNKNIEKIKKDRNMAKYFLG